jgi:hypothetical protein
MESPDMKSPGGEQTSQPSVAETRAQYVQEVMSGQNPEDRAYFKDEKGQFASPSNENATLNVRNQHIEQARQEMNADFAQREANVATHQETVAQAESRNTGANAQVPTPPQGQNFFQNESVRIVEEAKREERHNQEVKEANSRNDQLFSGVRTGSQNSQAFFMEENSRIQEEARRLDAHQEALDRDTEANKIPSVEETLRSGKPRYNLRVQRTSGGMEDDWFATGVFQDQNGVDRVRVWKESQDGTVLRKDVKLEELNQWNEKSPNTLSKKGQEFLRDSKEIQNDLQEKSFKESLTELMDEESAQRYLGFLARDLPEGQEDNVGPEQPIDTGPGQTPNIQEVFATIDQRLSQTQERLSGIESQIQEVNSQLAEIQTSGNLTQEQLLEHMRLSQEFQELISQRFEALLEQQRLDSEKSTALYRDLISRIGGGQQPEIPEIPEIPETPETPEIPGTQTAPTPGAASTEVEQLRQQLGTQEQEIANLRGENTPEQRSAILGRQLAELDAIQATRPLTDQEKIQYFDLLQARKTIDTQLQNVEKESTRKRNKKHTIIKVGSFVAGIGIGALTPPVSAAALIAVGLGGPLIGREGIKLSGKLRAKSNSLRYADRRNKTVTELAQIDQKIKRNEWWANRLGEVSSALMGAGAGYGAGKAVQSIVNMFRTPTTPPGGQTPPSEGNNIDNMQAPPAGEAGPTQESIELSPSQPVSTTGSELASGDWLRTGELGWDTSKWGWRGPDLFVPQSGVVEGAVPDLQGKFLNQLSELGVTKDMLYGQQAGEIFNQGLRSAAYTPGNNLQDVASATAEALKNLNP